jgi:hypothetical protein
MYGHDLHRRARGVFLATLSTVVLLVGGCSDDVLFPREAAGAGFAVSQWIHRNADGWRVHLDSPRPLTRPEWSVPCAENPPSGFVTLRYATRSTEIDLMFRCPVDGSASVADLDEAFAFAVLSRLPHGIQVPGWDVRVLTPSSHVQHEVAFSRDASGRMRVAVQTPLYAVYAYSRRSECEPPVHGPSPEGCYVIREHRVPLDLTLVAPFTGAELE